MIGATLVLITGMSILRRSLIELIEAPHEADHKEILSKKVKTLEVTKSMDMMAHIKHPPITTKGTLCNVHFYLTVWCNEDSRQYFWLDDYSTAMYRCYL